MTTITIGSSDVCDIKFEENGSIKTIWATISISDKNMLILKIISKDVICFVNKNNITDHYWIMYGDEININNFILDWALLNELLSSNQIKSSKSFAFQEPSSIIETKKDIYTQPTIYGPPPIIKKTSVYSNSTIYGPPPPIERVTRNILTKKNIIVAFAIIVLLSIILSLYIIMN